MRQSFEIIRRLVAEDAKHRKGFRLSELGDNDILSHAQDELNELREDHCVDELADVIGCLFHFAIKHGWTFDEIDTALQEKLKARFNK